MLNVAGGIRSTYFLSAWRPQWEQNGTEFWKFREEIALNLNRWQCFLVMGMMMFVLCPASCKLSHHFEFLSSAGLLSLPCPLARPHLMDVKVRGRTTQLALFPLQDLSVARPPWASRRMCLDQGDGGSSKWTLIAGHLTYPFPQLDVQPATVNGKWLSEGQRLDMQSADCALVLCCLWPSYLGAAAGLWGFLLAPKGLLPARGVAH